MDRCLVSISWKSGTVLSPSCMHYLTTTTTKLICLGAGTAEEREMLAGEVTYLRSTSDRLRFWPQVWAQRSHFYQYTNVYHWAWAKLGVCWVPTTLLVSASSHAPFQWVISLSTDESCEGWPPASCWLECSLPKLGSNLVIMKGSWKEQYQWKDSMYDHQSSDSINTWCGEKKLNYG